MGMNCPTCHSEMELITENIYNHKLPTFRHIPEQGCVGALLWHTDGYYCKVCQRPATVKTTIEMDMPWDSFKRWKP